ncbi:hypothetical protein MMC20_005731 [Loxospora ochrophaea]|nr:hypothetical protein [Loxospora ochrophaea]
MPNSSSGTPTTPSDDPRPPVFRDGQGRSQSDSTTSHPILNTQGEVGGKVLQRMDTIAPGPFDVGERNAPPLGPGHRRTATMGSDNGLPRAPAMNDDRNHIQRPSTANSDKSRKTSLAAISGGPRSSLNRGGFHLPSLPSEPVPQRPSRPENSDLGMLKVSQYGRDAEIETMQQDSRSRTFPLQGRNQDKNQDSTAPLSRRPSEPARPSHNRRPTVSSANRPLHEIGSTSSFKPHRSATTRTVTPARPEMKPTVSLDTQWNENRNDQRLNVPPVPAPFRAEDFDFGNPYHTPTESSSSNVSSASEANSGSSRSSPPLSDVSYKVRSTSDTRRIDNLMNDIQVTMQDTSLKEEPSPRWGATQSFSRPIYNKQTFPTPKSEPLIAALESPTDPAMQNGRLSPLAPPLNNGPSSRPPYLKKAYTSPVSNFPSEESYVTKPPPLQPQADPIPARRPTMNKGNCRGCGEVIKGKSVSSADGRLTGRYHKPCFVCKTCKEPFQTTDFYVLNNHPYCSRHYHQLNNSLCKTCDRGIEGQYLETEHKQKFHPHCLSCQVRSLSLI